MIELINALESAIVTDQIEISYLRNRVEELEKELAKYS